jgi:polyphosphate kinase
MSEARFINRETSWLEFNERVLYEAIDRDNPPLERAKFLSIVTSNLEEFFMIRVAVLKKQAEAGLKESEAGEISAAEQLAEIRDRVRKMLQRQYRFLRDSLLPELAKAGVRIVDRQEDLEGWADALESDFHDRLLPLLTPLSVGPTHPFPNLLSGRLYLAVELTPLPDNHFQEQSRLSFVEIPTGAFGRFLMFEGDGPGFIPVELVVRRFIGRLYGGYSVDSATVVRVTRDADISLQEDGASDLMKEIESTIKRMHRRSCVKLEHEADAPESLLTALREHLNLPAEDQFAIDGLLNLRDLFEIADKTLSDDLKLKPLQPVYPSVFEGRNPFEVIAEKDVLLIHPYHSYDPVVELVNRAADDPGVVAIKQTLYRTSSDSAIIRALARAAEKGKYVSVIDELKARFDEKRNIEWARRLEDAGAHVTYGVAGLKTHAKALIIVRKEASGIRRYVHLGTGNYNESTAKLYTDFSLFTSDDRIGEDVSSLFNLLTGFSLAAHWKSLTIAPIDLRNRFVSLIRREAENARNGLKAKITAKMNSLSDLDIIRELYAASQAGVKIRLLIRGICCLVPGVPGLSENIRVESIVGRFLEHSRIYCFNNNNDPEYFLASADWMMRNLDRRVEVLFPVRDRDASAFLQTVLDIQFEDNRNKWELDENGRYRLMKRSVKPRDSFEELYRLVKDREKDARKSKPQDFRPLRNPEEEE